MVTEYTDEYGQSWLPPWEKRGRVVRPRENVPAPVELLPDLSRVPTTDLCETVADYYLLEGLRQGVFGSGSEPEQQTDILLGGLVESIDRTMAAYFHAAIGGELRHHRSLIEKVLSVDHDMAQSGWYLIYTIVGPQALLDAAELFREYDYGLEDPENCCYGGEFWATAAELLYSRVSGDLGPTEASNKHVFVDLAFCLQHNTGNFLTKLQWKEKRLATKDVALLLDARSGADPQQDFLLYHASPPIQQYVRKRELHDSPR